METIKGPSLTAEIPKILVHLLYDRKFARPVRVSVTGQNGFVLRMRFGQPEEEPVNEEKSGPDTPLLPVDVVFTAADGRTARWRLDRVGGHVAFNEVA